MDANEHHEQFVETIANVQKKTCARRKKKRARIQDVRQNRDNTVSEKSGIQVGFHVFFGKGIQEEKAMKTMVANVLQT